MKAYKNLLAIVFILLTSAAFAILIPFDSTLFRVVFGVTISIFLLNILSRNSIAFKPYFTSKWNIFTSKFRKDFQTEIPSELIFDKLLEVIENSQFKLKYADKKKFEILATSEFTFNSWGENIYITLLESGPINVVRFESVTLFQMYSWGKNEKNFNKFLEQMEDSLTI